MAFLAKLGLIFSLAVSSFLGLFHHGQVATSTPAVVTSAPQTNSQTSAMTWHTVFDKSLDGYSLKPSDVFSLHGNQSRVTYFCDSQTSPPTVDVTLQPVDPQAIDNSTFGRHGNCTGKNVMNFHAISSGEYVLYFLTSAASSSVLVEDFY